MKAEPDSLGIFDDPRFARLVMERAEEYRTAVPFPHVVIEDFLDEQIAIRLERAFPKPDDIEWVVRCNQNNIRRFQHDETKLPRLMRHVLREFNSRQFILFVETLTGINRLVVFNVGDDCNHGQPEPLRCPFGEYRKVLNLYYYTTRRDEAEIHEPHFTLYKTQASPHAVELGERYRASANQLG